MKKLIEMIIDEKKAPADYYKLLKQLKTKRDKRVVQGIIRDERKHLGRLLKMKRRMK